MNIIQTDAASTKESDSGCFTTAWSGARMTSPYVEYLFRENAGIVLTVSPTAKSVTSLPTASTTPAQSYPRPAGNIGDSTYLSLRHIDSARLMPIAFTLIRTSCGPGAGTSTSMNSRTSGPPACANLIVRDMVPPLSRVEDVGFSRVGAVVRAEPIRRSFREMVRRREGLIPFRSGGTRTRCWRLAGSAATPDM